MYKGTLKQHLKLNSLKVNCEKSVQIRSYFWSVFPCIWTEHGGFRIQSKYRRIRTRNNSVFGHFSRSEATLRLSGKNELLLKKAYNVLS